MYIYIYVFGSLGPYVSCMFPILYVEIVDGIRMDILDTTFF